MPRERCHGCWHKLAWCNCFTEIMRREFPEVAPVRLAVFQHATIGGYIEAERKRIAEEINRTTYGYNLGYQPRRRPWGWS